VLYSRTVEQQTSPPSFTIQYDETQPSTYSRDAELVDWSCCSRICVLHIPRRQGGGRPLPNLLELAVTSLAYTLIVIPAYV